LFYAVGNVTSDWKLSCKNIHEKIETDMKRIALSARAQNTIQMTEEERQKILEELEYSYEMEMGSYFSIDRPAKVLSLILWDAWAYKYRDGYSGVSDLFGCLGNLSVESVDGEPKVYRLVFRGKAKGSEAFQDRRYVGQPWETHIDSLGACIGFREKIFYGLTTDVKLHLTNKKSKPVLCQEHTDDALILPEWIDSATVSNGITESEALSSAIAKFDFPAVPDSICKLKDNIRFTPDERNVLLAPNDMISYAVGVAQAEWIMEYCHHCRF